MSLPAIPEGNSEEEPLKPTDRQAINHKIKKEEEDEEENDGNASEGDGNGEDD